MISCLGQPSLFSLWLPPSQMEPGPSARSYTEPCQTLVPGAWGLIDEAQKVSMASKGPWVRTWPRSYPLLWLYTWKPKAFPGQVMRSLMRPLQTKELSEGSQLLTLWRSWHEASFAFPLVSTPKNWRPGLSPTSSFSSLDLGLTVTFPSNQGHPRS